MKHFLKKFSVVIISIYIISSIVPYELPVINNIKMAEAATVKLNKKEITINVGETYQLKISGTKSKVKWSSSKKSIASVSSMGLVNGKKAGSIIITAKVDNVELTCRVNVVVPTISYKKTENGIGGKTQFFIYNLPKEFKKEDVIWTSSNENVFIVDENGLVTNTGTGKAKLNATFGTYKLTKTIYVYASKRNISDAIDSLKIEELIQEKYIVLVIGNISKVDLRTAYQVEFYDTSNNMVSISAKNYFEVLSGEECVINIQKPDKEYSYYKIKYTDNNSIINDKKNFKDKVTVKATDEYDFTYTYYGTNFTKIPDTIKLFDLLADNQSGNRVILKPYVLFYKDNRLVKVVDFSMSIIDLDIGETIIKNPITQYYISQKIDFPEYDKYRIIYTANDRY